MRRVELVFLGLACAGHGWKRDEVRDGSSNSALHPVNMKRVRCHRWRADPICHSLVELDWKMTSCRDRGLHSLIKFLLAMDVAAAFQTCGRECNLALKIMGNIHARGQSVTCIGYKNFFSANSLRVPAAAMTLDASVLDSTNPPVHSVDREASAVNRVAHTVAKAWRVYVKDLMTARALQAGLIGFSADVLVQTIFSGVPLPCLDLRRSLSFFVFGTCYAGGFQPSVYRLSDRIFGSSVFRKTMADMFIYAPFVYIPSFYMITGTFQGLGWSGSLEQLSLKLVTTHLAYLKVWFIPMLVYFRWVPEKSRVLFLACFGFIEKCIYSYLQSLKLG